MLRERENTLGAVVVEGDRPAVRAEQGKLIYDPQILAQGRTVNNAWELLSELPGVSERDGVLSLAGSGSVTVILNGRPSSMSADQFAALLRSTPVDRIERAEVMYSTPPQYHVRGAAINLVLRHSRGRALSGELHGSYSNRYFGSWSGGGSLVLSSSAWSADAIYSAGQDKVRQQIGLHARHTLAEDTYDISQSQTIVGETRAPRHNLRFATEYAPEGKSRWSAAYTASFSPHGRNTTRADGSFVRSENRADGESTLHNLALRWTSPSGTDLCADYTRYTTGSQTLLSNEYAGGGGSRFDIASGQTVDRLDLTIGREHALTGRLSLNYGGLFSRVRDRDWQYYTLREGAVAASDTDSRLDEYTGNLHAGLSGRFAAGNYSFSLAGEYYRTGSRGEWSLYPQASLLWTPGERHLLQLTLSSDKTYPSYWEMQQATTYVDGYAEIHGTPGLRPSKSCEGQLLYMYRNKYLLMLFWNEEPDYFMQAAWQASDRTALVYQSLNWNTNRTRGLHAVVPLRVGIRLDSRLTLTGARMTQRCDTFHDISFDRSKWVATAQIDNAIRLSRKPDLTLDLAASARSSAIQATYDIEPTWRIDLGAKWRFADGRAVLTVRCNDLFEHGIPVAKVRYRGQWLDLDTSGYSRSVTFQLSCSFGGYKKREYREVDTSRFGH